MRRASLLAAWHDVPSAVGYLWYAALRNYSIFISRSPASIVDLSRAMHTPMGSLHAGTVHVFFQRAFADMSHYISFFTPRFGAYSSHSCLAGPHGGEALLEWLRRKLSAWDYEATSPTSQEWGWQMEIDSDSATYVVGISVDIPASALPPSWVMQIHKRRSIEDKLAGRNRMQQDDPLSMLIEEVLRGEEWIAGIEVDAFM